MQDALQRKTKQEQLRKEHKKMQVLYDTKDIFVEAFDTNELNEDRSRVEQLVHIVDKVNIEDIEANTKLMECSEKKYQTKVAEKISSTIALGQVDLSTKVDGVKTLLDNI